jgi:hypothetical protein
VLTLDFQEKVLAVAVFIPWRSCPPDSHLAGVVLSLRGVSDAGIGRRRWRQNEKHRHDRLDLGSIVNGDLDRLDGKLKNLGPEQT